MQPDENLVGLMFLVIEFLLSFGFKKSIEHNDHKKTPTKFF